VNVLLVTVFVGAVLVLFFVAFFLLQTAASCGSSERDALLPLAKETPRNVSSTPVTPTNPSAQ
jgi:NADH:ubiquinone oxidoreductase subunit 6 (subunit J)